MHKQFNRNLLASLTIALVAAVAAPNVVNAAENLKLADGISFTTDAGTVFPILGDRMDDLTVQPGRPALIFFGAAGDLNTNRQAKRVVQLYNKHHDDTKFIIVNVDSTEPASRELVKKFYKGYVPSQVLMDKDGKTVWSQVGEISRKELGGKINNM